MAILLKPGEARIITQAARLLLTVASMAQVRRKWAVLSRLVVSSVIPMAASALSSNKTEACKRACRIPAGSFHFQFVFHPVCLLSALGKRILLRPNAQPSSCARSPLIKRISLPAWRSTIGMTVSQSSPACVTRQILPACALHWQPRQ